MQSALRIAQEHSSQEVDGEHLFAALLEPEDGLIQPLLQKLGVPMPKLVGDLKALLERRGKVKGTSEPFLSDAFKRSLASAEEQAKITALRLS